MQKLSACRKRRSEIQRRRSTSSWCITAICPAGPPKLMKPSFSQYSKASRNKTAAGAASGLDCECAIEIVEDFFDFTEQLVVVRVHLAGTAQNCFYPCCLLHWSA